MAQPVVVHTGGLRTLNIPTQRCGAVGIHALQGGVDVNATGTLPCPFGCGIRHEFFFCREG
ncbi:hypothetical protein DEQ92_20595 [Haloferax sp. Atlit-6N]|nr:hypothetical protein DEQ92_20595 [Haloferax sp. Atlit-6N]